jgi:adenylate cyclase class IV
MAVEVELRSFITKEKYGELLRFFAREGRLLGSDNQVTYTLNDRNSVRIQRNDSHSKLWIKMGKGQHDPIHEEIEVRFDRKDFNTLARAMEVMGFPPLIKWFRKRTTFKWQGVSVMVDSTKGYGYILELEKVCGKAEQAKALGLLKRKMDSLGIEVTPKEEFDRKFTHYRNNWKSLTGSR